MISVNSFFEIGSTHKVCEDYASSGIITSSEGKEYYYGIVSDGCSSSENTDIGSRIVSLAFTEFISVVCLYDAGAKKILEDEIYLGKVAHGSLHHLYNTLYGGLRKNGAYDATAMVFVSDGDTVRVYVRGDGIVVARNNEKTTVYDIEYTTNAPYYLSYSLSESRTKTYSDQFGNGKIIIKSSTIYKDGSVDNIDEKEHDISDPNIHMLFSLSEYDSVSLFSDGLRSFTSSNSDTSRAELRYTDFPRPFGEYVVRNFQFNRKYNLKNSTQHQDDLSCASIIRFT